jgi:hypothetical protein
MHGICEHMQFVSNIISNIVPASSSPAAMPDSGYLVACINQESTAGVAGSVTDLNGDLWV